MNNQTNYYTTPGSGYSSSCPHCNPRCPHGYPADYSSRTPWFSITNGSVGDVDALKSSFAKWQANSSTPSGSEK